MRLYPVPRSGGELEEIRAQIKKDYEALSEKYSMPAELHFAEIVKAVATGMVPAIGYPYRKKQEDLIGILHKQNISIDEMNHALGIASAVWNYFPHDDMGTSPIEKTGEYMQELDGSDERFDHEEMAAIMSAVADDLIPILSKIMREILAIHMKVFGFKNPDINAVAGILEEPKTDPEEASKYLLGKAVDLAKKDTKKKYLMGDLQPTVRALAAYENHAASKMPDGHFNSRMFQNIIQQHIALYTADMLDERPEEEFIEFINPAAYLEKIFETHRHIAKTGNSIRAVLPLQEAAHHILDWIGLIDIRELLKYDVETLTVLILTVAHRISKTGDPEGALGCSEKKIRARLKNAFIDTAECESEIIRIAQLVLCGCGDVSLLIADVANAPEDSEDRLAVIAPCLKLRSPVRPADLPIPSPFSF